VRGGRHPPVLPPLQRAALLTRVSKIVTSDGHLPRAEARKLAIEFKTTEDAVLGVAQRRKRTPEKAHGNRLLTSEEEQALAAWADAHSLKDIPLSRQEFFVLVKGLRPDLANKNLQTWFLGFMQRWSDKLCERSAEALTAERSSTASIPSVELFVIEFPRFVMRHHLSEKWIINVDETRIIINSTSLAKKAIVTKRRSKHRCKESRKGKCASWVPFVRSTGEIIMDVFIVPILPEKGASFVLEPAGRPSRKDSPTFWTFTESGYMNGKLWLECLKKLRNIIDETAPGIIPIILNDNLSAHQQTVSLEWCLANRLFLFFLPPQTTHFLDPLDDTTFTSFKRFLTLDAVKHKSLLAAKRMGLAEAVLQSAQQARKKLTTKVLQASFRNTGIYPWDGQLILDRAHLNIGETKNNSQKEDSAFDCLSALGVERIDAALHSDEDMRVHVDSDDVEKGYLFSAAEILESRRKKAAEKEAVMREKEQRRDERAAKKRAREEGKALQEREREKVTCRGKHCGTKRQRVWHGQGTWMWCDTCDEYGMCPNCRVADFDLLRTHEKFCPSRAAPPPPKRHRHHSHTPHIEWTTHKIQG